MIIYIYLPIRNQAFPYSSIAVDVLNDQINPTLTPSLLVQDSM